MHGDVLSPRHDNDDDGRVTQAGLLAEARGKIASWPVSEFHFGVSHRTTKGSTPAVKVAQPEHNFQGTPHVFKMLVLTAPNTRDTVRTPAKFPRPQNI